MKVKEIMNTDVKTASPDITVQEAAKKMGRFYIGSLIIVKNEKLAGIITERDILVKVVAKGRNPSNTKTRTVMTKEVIMIRPDTEIGDACEVMVKKKIKKLPVIEKDSLVGIVTATDIITAQPEMLKRLGELFLIPGKKKMVAG